MANSNFQTITKPKLYVSYPLYQYANGALDSLATNYGVSDEDMIRMIESGEKLPDYCQEEFDNIIFCKIKEKKDVKTSIRRTRRVFTDVGKSQGMGLSGQDANSRTIRSDSKLQQRSKTARK